MSPHLLLQVANHLENTIPINHLQDQTNHVNAELVKRINEDGRIHLVPSSSKGRYYLRFAVGSTLTETSDIQYAWSVIKELANQLLGEKNQV